MKRIFFSLVLLTATIHISAGETSQAAISGLSSSASTSADDPLIEMCEHNESGVHIQVWLKKNLFNDKVPDYARIFAWELGLGLLSQEKEEGIANDISFNMVESYIRDVLHGQDNEICALYKTGALRLKRSERIMQLVINVAVQRSGVRVQARSADDGKPYASYVPPFGLAVLKQDETFPPFEKKDKTLSIEQAWVQAFRNERLSEQDKKPDGRIGVLAPGEHCHL